METIPHGLDEGSTMDVEKEENMLPKLELLHIKIYLMVHYLRLNKLINKEDDIVEHLPTICCYKYVCTNNDDTC